MVALESLHNSDLRYTNKINILNLLRDQIISRADISNQLQLSKSSVSNIVEELLDCQWIEEIGLGKSTEQGGKKPVLLKFNEKAALIAGVYFSYNLVEVAITDLKGCILARSEMQLQLQEDCWSQCVKVAMTISSLLTTLRGQGRMQPLMAVGLVVKGLVDIDKGVLSYSATLPGWENVPLAQYFRTILGVPCFVENDVRAVTLLELDRLREKKAKVLMCVNAERGVGVGLAIDGHIFYGANSGISTTHMILDPNGPLCSCGNRGCWDIMASVETMLSQIARQDSSLKDITYKEAVRLYQLRNKVVRDVVENYTGYWMSLGVRNAVTCYNPDLVVLIGSCFLDFPILAACTERTLHTMPNIVAREVKVIFAPSEDDLFLHSAASVVFSRFFSKQDHEELANAVYHNGEC